MLTSLVSSRLDSLPRSFFRDQSPIRSRTSVRSPCFGGSPAARFAAKTTSRQISAPARWPPRNPLPAASSIDKIVIRYSERHTTVVGRWLFWPLVEGSAVDAFLRSYGGP